MKNRPLRDFEKGAHLHVLDWAHDTARYRFQQAGAVQVKAAAKAWAGEPVGAPGPPQLPSLEAALTGELRKMYALGHATVRSEIDHQQNGSPLPVGLSQAPEPPNLRDGPKNKQGKVKNCASCKMYDAGAHACWGYGMWPVKPNEVCDSYVRDPKVKTLALDDSRRDPGRMRVRARLAAQAVAVAVWQAIQRAKLQGITDIKRLRQIGRDAGNSALAAAASNHAGGAISAGRHAAALTVLQGGKNTAPGAATIVGARYTSVLDKNTCGPCAAADTGELIPVGDPAWIPTPNPACLGGDRCRCIHVYQLSTETGSAAGPAGNPAATGGTTDGRDVKPIATVGVGSS